VIAAIATDLQEYLYRVSSQVPFEHAQWANERGAALLGQIKNLANTTPAATVPVGQVAKWDTVEGRNWLDMVERMLSMLANWSPTSRNPLDTLSELRKEGALLLNMASQLTPSESPAPVFQEAIREPNRAMVLAEIGALCMAVLDDGSITREDEGIEIQRRVLALIRNCMSELVEPNADETGRTLGSAASALAVAKTTHDTNTQQVPIKANPQLIAEIRDIARGSGEGWRDRDSEECWDRLLKAAAQADSAL
jgi:hypothetical protein